MFDTRFYLDTVFFLDFHIYPSFHIITYRIQAPTRLSLLLTRDAIRVNPFVLVKFVHLRRDYPSPNTDLKTR